MPQNWKTYKLDDVAIIKYGKDHKNLKEGSIPCYGTGGIMRYVDKCLSEEESVLIPRKGSLNNIYYINKPFWTVDTLFWTQVDSSKILPKYLYYNFKTLDFASKDVGSAVPSLTTSLLNEIEITIPELKEQTAIASILSALDDKIELNLQMNKTLEEMAMALYKHWFVDFTPFKSPLEGGMGDVNSEFIDSELGKIPKGWEVKRLEDFVKHQKGFAFKSKWYQDKGKLIVRVSDTTANSIDVNTCNRISDELSVQYKDYALNTNDIIIATVGSWPPNYSSVVGKVVKVPSIAEEALLNQNAVRLKMDIDGTRQQGLLYYSLKTDRFLNYIVNSAQGSASQASIKLTDIFNYPIPYTDKSKFDDFLIQVESFLDQQNSLISENQTLTNLRDTLLPKLISGEVRVKDVEKTISAVL